MQDIFLSVDGVKGESADDSHKEEIDVLSWSWGMSQSGTTHIGGGGGAGKVSVTDLSVTKYVDKSSTVLMKGCCNGKHYEEAVLTLRKAGETPLEYLKITMTEVLISSISIGGSGGEDRVTENITLNFAKYKAEYLPQKKDGSGDAAVEVGWDIAKNIEA